MVHVSCVCACVVRGVSSVFNSLTARSHFPLSSRGGGELAHPIVTRRPRPIVLATKSPATQRVAKRKENRD
jgi:hypothetical protein